MYAFRPSQPSVTLAASSTSADEAISPVYPVLEVQNAGPDTVFLRWGVGAQTALVTDYPVLAGQAKTITIGTGNTFVAGITAAGTATVYVTSGEGV